MFMINGSGYSVTTASDVCLRLGSVVASREGRALVRLTGQISSKVSWHTCPFLDGDLARLDGFGQ